MLCPFLPRSILPLLVLLGDFLLIVILIMFMILIWLIMALIIGLIIVLIMVIVIIDYSLPLEIMM